jgi:beta-glucanase (GH16 family)
MDTAPGVAGTLRAPAQEIEAADGGRFVLSWRDEFDGPKVDRTKWHVVDEHVNAWPTAPWRRNWKASNVYTENGSLVIRTQREAKGFSTGGLRTNDYQNNVLFEQAFGRFEARMRFQKQPGHWPAFWLMSHSVGNVSGSGRDGTEIDIIEKAWLGDKASHALHWDGYGKDHKSEGHSFTGFGLDDDRFHVIALEWYPHEYRFFVDGKLTWQTSAGDVSHVPAYIKLTEEIENFGEGPDAWGTGPIETAELPDYFYVDYVRVWRYEPPK